MNQTREQELFNAAGLRVFERGWLSANNILFVGNNNHRSVLVDTGYCSQAEQTLALVEHAMGETPLDRIINTHLHSDHCGGNRALQSRYGCEIDVPANEAPIVDVWDEAALTYRATGQSCPRFRRTGVLSASSETELGTMTWEVLSASGHDPNSVILYQPDLQILISADALWEKGMGVIFPELEGNAGFDEARKTLETIASLTIRCVIPGHGSPFAEASQALDTAFERLAAFVADPVRHARHAAKVLIKFHVLAFDGNPLEDLARWSDETWYLHTTHLRYFAKQTFSHWCQDLVAELCRSGALRIEGGRIFN